MKEQSHVTHEGSRVGSTVVYRHPFVAPRGVEVFVRIALCALSALLVSLAWILASSAPADARHLTVLIGLAAIGAMSLMAGLTRSENDKLRAEFAESEARTLAAVELMIREHRFAPPTFTTDVSDMPPELSLRL